MRQRKPTRDLETYRVQRQTVKTKCQGQMKSSTLLFPPIDCYYDSNSNIIRFQSKL
jgi:hypothetical protein